MNDTNNTAASIQKIDLTEDAPYWVDQVVAATPAAIADAVEFVMDNARDNACDTVAESGWTNDVEAHPEFEDWYRASIDASGESEAVQNFFGALGL